MEKGRDPKEEETQRACCLGDFFHTREKDTQKSLARAALELPFRQHTPSQRSTQWHDRTQNVNCAEVGSLCETPFIQADTGCVHGMLAGTCTWQ